jgi:hypothetical protein
VLPARLELVLTPEARMECNRHQGRCSTGNASKSPFRPLTLQFHRVRPHQLRTASAIDRIDSAGHFVAPSHLRNLIPAHGGRAPVAPSFRRADGPVTTASRSIMGQ